MKIITDDAVYVQKNDISFLMQTDLTIPASVYLNVFGRRTSIIDDSNRFDFVKFDEKNIIDFFMNLDWILDFEDVKYLDESQIVELGCSISNERNDIASKYNNMSDLDRALNHHLIFECECLEYKMYSLRDFLLYKQGRINFVMPVEKKKNNVKNKLCRIFNKSYKNK